MSSKLAPIVLFTYNRPWHLQQTVEALLQNPLAKDSLLYVFSDAAKNETSRPLVEQVRTYIHQIKGFKEVIIEEKVTNSGLATSVIQGVTKVLEKHQKAIVLEDDMVSSKSFLNFMNEALDFYQDIDNIFCITGWSPPIQIPDNYPQDVYVAKRASSWGWATWLNQWQKADWDVEDFAEFFNQPTQQKAFNKAGEDLTPMLKKQQKGLISSWAIRWTYTLFKQSGYCLYPTSPKINNIGTDGSGSHSPNNRKADVQLSNNSYSFVSQIGEDEQVLQEFRKFYKLSLVRKIINKVKLG